MTMRMTLRFAFVLGLAGLLSACFQPVNSPSLLGGQMNERLSQVSVSKAEGYMAYILKAELDYLLTNGAPAKNTRYHLELKTHQGRGSSIIDAATARAQSVTLQVEASYELRDIKTGKIKGSGKTFASANYDRSQQRFATIRAQRDAEEKVGKALAERLKIIVASILATDHRTEAAPAPSLITPHIDPLEEKPERDPGNDS